MIRRRLVRALRGEEVDRRPIWLMRQAGRYLPGYQRLRETHSVLEIARSPELASAVTLEPVRRFDVDAAVVYADITLPLAGLGIEFRIDPGVGPVVPDPIRTREAVDRRLTGFDAEASVGFVGEAIRKFLAAGTDRPIIGFAGGPFTLASYLIEGGPRRDLVRTRKMMTADPATFDRLLRRLTEMTGPYLKMQARAGAAALQLFDTWVGAVSARRFARHLAPGLTELFGDLRATGVPTIYFSTASSHLLGEFDRLGSDALGVDWRVPLGRVRTEVGDRLALQGNLDPAALLGDRGSLEEAAREVLQELPDAGGHIFNLGHGVLPDTDPERIRELVELVHATPPYGSR